MHPTGDVTLTGTEPDKVPAFIQVRTDITLRKYGCCTSKAVWGSKHSWGLSKWMSTSFVVQRNLTSALAFWTTDSNFAYLHPKLSCPLLWIPVIFKAGQWAWALWWRQLVPPVSCWATGMSGRDTDQNTSLHTDKLHLHWLMQAHRYWLKKQLVSTALISTGFCQKPSTVWICIKMFSAFNLFSILSLGEIAGVHWKKVP